MSKVNNTNTAQSIASHDSGNEKSGLNDVFSIITSVIAICAGLYGIISNFTNAMYASNAEKFYKIPSEIFYYNRNFHFITSIVIYVFTVFVLIGPFLLRDKWRYRKIDKTLAFFWSSLISLYMLFFISITCIRFLVEISIKFGAKFTTIAILIGYVLLCWFFYFLITGTFKFWGKDNKNQEMSRNRKEESNVSSITMAQKILYPIYVIIIIAIILFLNIRLTGPDTDPKDKLSYEIIQCETDYNAIIGYKDGLAITLNGDEFLKDDSKTLKFTSDKYKLQDLKDKIIVYKTFDKVEPFKGDEDKKEKSNN